MTNQDPIRKEAEKQAWRIVEPVNSVWFDDYGRCLSSRIADDFEKHLRRIAELEERNLEDNADKFNALNELDRYQRMFNRIKSICVGDGTFLTGAQIKIIEEQEQ